MRNKMIFRFGLVFLTGSFWFSTLNVQAQTPTTTGAPAAQTDKRLSDKREDRQERRHLDLDLTADQKTKMKAIRAAYKPKIQAIRQNTTLTKKQKAAQLKPLMQAEQREVSAILTPEQRTKLNSFRRDEKNENKMERKLKFGK